MKTRNPTNKIDPATHATVRHLENFLAESMLDKIHYKLIKIRASQINGCAYCIHMHAKAARKMGLSEEKIYLLNVWRETQLYTAEEMAILELTEEVTRIAEHGVSDRVYDQAMSLLGKPYTRLVILAIVTINAWNRIAITDRLLPE